MSGEGTLAEVLAGEARWCVVEGDCLDVLPTLAEKSVDAVVTSPPYAEQRKGQYASVAEDAYPGFTVRWVSAVPLTANGNILINILEHIQDGQISDYVHRTRLALREVLTERDELIWHKPGAGSLTGNTKMPARSWERILWFAPSGASFVAAKQREASGGRIGGNQGGNISTGATVFHAGLPARIESMFRVSTRDNDGLDHLHPAAFPGKLARKLIPVFSPEGAVILDPFAGSGTTGVAALRLGRRCILIEREPRWAELCRERLRAEESGSTLGARRAGQVPMFGGER